MNRIALLLPYFGQYPNYFSLWVKTAKKNNFIDFYIITDQVKTPCTDHNIYYIPMTLSKLKEKIQECFDFEIKFNRAYKICDFRPAFGIIFSEITSEYDFWGHCDSDIIWGDLQEFITDEILNKYDKIYSHGHLTIYKNIDFINNLYLNSVHEKMLSYKDVFKTNYPCHFDESEGMTFLCDRFNIKTYSEIDFADIQYSSFCFNRAQDRMKQNYIYTWDDGILFESYYESNLRDIVTRKCAYVHLQKRRMGTPLFSSESCKIFFIVPNLFIDNTVDNIKPEYILRKHTESKGIYWDFYKGRFKTIKFKILNGYIKYKIIRFLRKVNI